MHTRGRETDRRALLQLTIVTRNPYSMSLSGRGWVTFPRKIVRSSVARLNLKCLSAFVVAFDWAESATIGFMDWFTDEFCFLSQCLDKNKLDLTSEMKQTGVFFCRKHQCGKKNRMCGSCWVPIISF